MTSPIIQTLLEKGLFSLLLNLLYTSYLLINLHCGRSWLLFHLLKLNKRQEWMLVPCNLWILFEDYRVAKEFVDSLITVNDCAERGIKLIGDYKDSCFDKKERESLAQLVEQHRSNFSISNMSKEAMKTL